MGFQRISQKDSYWGRPKNRGILLGRACVGFVAMSCFFFSISELPLKDATVINFTSPMFTAVFAWIFLGEPFGIQEVAATAFSFLGVLMVAQPPFLFHRLGSGSDPGLESRRAAAVLIGCVGAACAGAAYTLVRAAGKLGEPPLVPVLWFSSTSVPAAAVFLLLCQSPVWPSFSGIAGMALVGTAAFGGQVFLSRGLQLERAAKAMSLQYVKVLFSYMLGMFVLQETANLSGTFGALLIAASALIVMKEHQNDSELLRDVDLDMQSTIRKQ
eukprot:CAMPEP_0114226060 /NCGR_PEP_ID=MMETSP0058-20121206/1028_1 /TAXON_ID=36894 /ORGANISM="Pyramimonas parkeae, CCMP726" /LENGTH=270 /DNA_ID=CAMNT_0001336755 /DNA_START=319 /DNA_END=1131 /DNA_ORIENTATION=+